MQAKNKLYIIPDVHGRHFWEIIKDIETTAQIIFLGDYLDPYQDENITKRQTIDNFEEIIEFAKAKSNVHLLLGNHDMEYTLGKWACNCRCDNKNYHKIQKIFFENKELFDVIYQCVINDKKCILSHAGIHPVWLENHNYNANDIEDFNRLYHDYNLKFVRSLADVSIFRGGEQFVGSPIWSDIREYQYVAKKEMSNIADMQICGHTHLMEYATLDNGISCIDTEQIYFINENNELGVLDYA